MSEKKFFVQLTEYGYYYSQGSVDEATFRKLLSIFKEYSQAHAKKAI